MSSETPHIRGSDGGNETPSLPCTNKSAAANVTIGQQSQPQTKTDPVASQQQQQLYPKPHPTMPSPLYSNFASSSSNNNNGLPRANRSSQISASPASGTASHCPSTSNLHPRFTKGEGVPEPRPTDVICGRGKMTASHPANRRFRELVDSHKASYQNSKRRDEKTRITCELVDKLRGEGRFVLFDPHTKLWYEVSEEYAREKVSHSLRSRSSSDHRTISNTGTSSSNVPQKVPGSNGNNDSNTAVAIAPRSEGTSIGNSSSPAISVPVTSKNPASTSSSSDAINYNQFVPNSGVGTVTKKNASSTSGGSLSGKSKTTGGKKKTKTIPHKTTHSSSRSLKASKNSLVSPDLDEIVKRLICDQQELLRGMIQKETERFTSAAAMGPPPRPMPLSFRAEASAVSTLTASLPKMGTAAAPPDYRPQAGGSHAGTDPASVGDASKATAPPNAAVAPAGSVGVGSSDGTKEAQRAAAGAPSATAYGRLLVQN
ncbi:unnamed protein product [Pseudo-nitzschia multistriata]|uniref:DUF6824 domain-containing protein n=1 Tax=Pseudo-nitzschia multistriata TaxID=183589 RepID=A0A448ZD59_9STRA|nr:unnamed protein product [Pseudo-nitzschia multistriata]